MYEWVREILKYLNSEFSTIVIGLSGGIVALKFENNKITVGKAVLILLSGVFGSVYLGNALAEYLMVSGKLEDALKFLVALSSMRIFEMIFTLLEEIKKSPTEFIKIIKEFIEFKNTRTKK